LIFQSAFEQITFRVDSCRSKLSLDE